MEAGINVNNVAGYTAAQIAGQKNCRVGDLGGIGIAAKRSDGRDAI